MRNSPIRTAALTMSAFAIAAWIPNTTWAHGTMVVPESRVYKCRFNGNPENHQNPACRAAVRLGGTQPIYDWNGVRQGNANGQHESIIPDGQHCSGGNATFRGLDLPRTDWQTTAISPDSNGQFEFIYHATAPHATQDMVFYVTPDSHSPGQPLRWDDLQEFCRHTQVPLVDIPGGRKGYRMVCDLPAKNGKHVIFNTWQRSDSPEAFYSCSDVEFAGGTNSDLKLLGTVVANEELPAGTVLNFRLLDEQSLDVEQIETVIQENSGSPNLWPFVVAQTVNAQSQFVRIGRLSGNGEVVPSQGSNANQVYSLTDRNFTFVIDKQIPIDPNEPPVPTPAPAPAPAPTPVPTDPGAFSHVYPEGIGQYVAGTIVKGQDGSRYQCRPFPFSGWCNQAPAYYGPGVGYAWEQAWTKL